MVRNPSSVIRKERPSRAVGAGHLENLRIAQKPGVEVRNALGIAATQMPSALNIAARQQAGVKDIYQGFNSALTMLDRAGGGGGGDYAESGSDFGSSRPAARERQPAMAGGGGKRGDLDDEIPF